MRWEFNADRRPIQFAIPTKTQARARSERSASRSFLGAVLVFRLNGRPPSRHKEHDGQDQANDE